MYHYQIYAPKTPKGFFDDTLLFGMLIKALGDTDANRFKTIYQFTANSNPENGKDISSSFLDAYQPNFDDPAFLKAMNGSDAIGRRNGKNSSFGINEYHFFSPGHTEADYEYVLSGRIFPQGNSRSVGNNGKSLILAAVKSKEGSCRKD